MDTLCGASCEKCGLRSQCRGCTATCGRPFGGDCIAASIIRTEGKAAYASFRQQLLEEVNALLKAEGFPPAAALFELWGGYVDLPYPLPSGASVPFLDESKIYLGCQIEVPGADFCCGVVADRDFILISRYSENGADPMLLRFQRRNG